MWYIATTVPLTTRAGKPLFSENTNFVKEINLKVDKYLNGNASCLRISRETLALPKKRGGLGLQLIAEKALALRAKQINQALDSKNTTPAAQTARAWLSSHLHHAIPWTKKLPSVHHILIVVII